MVKKHNLTKMIGTKYKKTIERLNEKIKMNLIKVVDGKNCNSKFKSNFACYFCGKKIEGKVRILIESNSNGETDHYSIGAQCYARAKGIEIV